MKAYKVYFENGNSLITEMNCDYKEAKAYYIHKLFNLGIVNDDMQKCANVIELEPYEGWNNSETWNVSWLLNQDVKAYEFLSGIRKQGKQVTVDDVKRAFVTRRQLIPKETWTKGGVDWQEIADNYNDEEYV